MSMAPSLAPATYKIQNIRLIVALHLFAQHIYSHMSIQISIILTKPRVFFLFSQEGVKAVL